MQVFMSWVEREYWKISEQNAKIANNLHKSKQRIAKEIQSLYHQIVLLFCYLRKSKEEIALVLYVFDFPCLSPPLFAFIVFWGLFVFKSII